MHAPSPVHLQQSLEHLVATTSIRFCGAPSVSAGMSTFFKKYPGLAFKQVHTSQQSRHPSAHLAHVLSSVRYHPVLQIVQNSALTQYAQSQPHFSQTPEETKYPREQSVHIYSA